MGANYLEPRCVKESAAHTGLSIATLYRLARLGEISHHWEGRQLRFFTADLDAFLTCPTAVTETDRSIL
jgi:excisionase family DNA binding protein